MWPRADRPNRQRCAGLVDGDLNWIVMKALEKARERRYASVAELGGRYRKIPGAPASYGRAGGPRLPSAEVCPQAPAGGFGTAAGIMFLGLIGVTIWSFLHRNAAPIPKPANKGTIVLGEFTNSTGDPVFDGMLRQLTAGELGKSHSMSVLPDARISGTLRLMVRPADTKLTPDIASEICERTGSAGVVEGRSAGWDAATAGPASAKLPDGRYSRLKSKRRHRRKTTSCKP